jgi:hypothetical protein
MRRYSERRKREMDLAVFTVDVSDFLRYRLPRGKAFTLL